MADDGADPSTSAAITASLTSSLAVILLVLWRVVVWCRKRQGHHVPPDIEVAAMSELGLGPVGLPIPEPPDPVAGPAAGRGLSSPRPRDPDSPQPQPPPTPAAPVPAGRRLTFAVAPAPERRHSEDSAASVPELVTRWQNAAWALPGQTGLAGRSHGAPESTTTA